MNEQLKAYYEKVKVPVRYDEEPGIICDADENFVVDLINHMYINDPRVTGEEIDAFGHRLAELINQDIERSKQQ